MASDDPRNQYRKELERLDTATKNGHVSPDEADAITEFLEAKDPDNLSVVDPDGESLAPSSLAAYAQALRLVSKRHDDPDGDGDARSLPHVARYRFVGVTRYDQLPGNIRENAAFLTPIPYVVHHPLRNRYVLTFD